MKTRILTILIVCFFIAGLVSAQVTIRDETRLRTRLMQQLKVSAQEADGIMAQLRVRLRDQKQQHLALDARDVTEVLGLCQRNRIRTQEVAAVLAAGSGFMTRMRQYGEPIKDARREMYQTMTATMQQTRQGEKVAQALQTRLRVWTRQAGTSGDGQQNRNQYRKGYQGERRYNGCNGGKKGSTTGSR